MSTFIRKIFRRRLHLSTFHLTAQFTTATATATASKPKLSDLYTKYNFKPPLSLKPQPKTHPRRRPKTPPQEVESPNKFTPQHPPKPRYRPPSSLDRTGKKPIRSDLPFDFRFSYTESDPDVRPIGLREPKYSPFGPQRVDRVWTGVCAPVIDPKEGNVQSAKELEEKRKKRIKEVQGEPLTDAERQYLVGSCQKRKTRKQVNLGRDGLTHNMLNDIHNGWKHAEAVRIKCMGVPTVDMKKVCYQLEDKTFGKIISRHGGYVFLYRGRNYIPKRKDVVPLMLWKPHDPVYPKLIKSKIDGLSTRETTQLRRKALAVPAFTKLAKNGYYGNLVAMVRDAFLCDELARIDCEGLPKSDYRKIGLKLRDLVPCILVSFDNEQIVVWRGKDYKPVQQGYFFSDRETFNNPDSCTDEKEAKD